MCRFTPRLPAISASSMLPPSPLTSFAPHKGEHDLEYHKYPTTLK